MEALGIILVIIVGIVAAAIAHHFEKKRREALRQWAQQGGWSYHEAKRHNPGHPFDLFNSGLKRWSRYHASKQFPDATPGLDPANLQLFEYHYAERRSDGKRTYYEHFYFNCCIATINADLGAIFLRDEHFGDRIAGAIGFDDIDLEDPNFSKRFLLKARDRKDAYDLFDANMMDFMCKHSGWVIQTAGPLLLVYRKGKVDPHKLKSIAAFTTDFLAHLPRLLVNTQRAKQGLPPLIEGGSVATRYQTSNEPIPNQPTQQQQEI